MNLRTILLWTAVVFLAWFVIRQPVQAAHLVHGIGGLLSQAASGLSRFIAQL